MRSMRWRGAAVRQRTCRNQATGLAKSAAPGPPAELQGFSALRRSLRVRHEAVWRRARRINGSARPRTSAGLRVDPSISARFDEAVKGAILEGYFSTLSFRSRKSASANRIPGCISFPSTGLGRPPAPLRCSRRMPGSPTQLWRPVCKSCGATATVSGPTAYPARPTAKSSHSRNCPCSSERLDRECRTQCM